jgi:hypothetical protein
MAKPAGRKLFRRRPNAGSLRLFISTFFTRPLLKLAAARQSPRPEACRHKAYQEHGQRFNGLKARKVSWVSLPKVWN